MKPSPLILSLLLTLFLLPGCPDSDDDDDNGGDDDSAGGDDDDAVGDDDDAVGDDDDDTAPESTDGSVSITLYRMPDGQGGVLEGGSFNAMFFEELVAPTGGVVTGMPSGPEECVVTTYTYDELMGGTQGEYEYLSAGPITVEGPGLSFTVQPTSAAGIVSYSQIFHPGGDQPVPGSTYDVSAAGADLSAFTTTVELPVDLELTSPPIAQNFQASGDFEIQWSGGDADSVWISVSSSSGEDYGTVYCEANNDGSFTVPGNQLGQIPSGGATLTVTQPIWDYVEVDGYWIYVFGGTYSTASGGVG